jgi:hypothetical protein
MRATVIVGIAGIIGILLSIKITSDRADKAISEAASQTKAATEQIRQARYVTIAGWTLELDKIYIQHPEIMPYFEEGTQITKDSQDYPLAAATAEFIIDLMDSMLDAYNDKWPDEGWRNWAEDTFSTSPIFRSHLEKQRSWYCKHLYPEYLVWSKKDGNPRAPEQETCK